MTESRKKPTVVIVGAGFAGYYAARGLSRLVGATTNIVVINSTDYFLYLPLMPEVMGGLLAPGHIRVSLARRLRKMRFGLVDWLARRGFGFTARGARYTIMVTLPKMAVLHFAAGPNRASPFDAAEQRECESLWQRPFNGSEPSATSRSAILSSSR